MGGERDDNGPYRTPVELPPPSEPPRSPRVLSALARLRSARGDIDQSAALSERAARARSNHAPRPLGRCDHTSLLARDRRRAIATYESWLRAAEGRPTRDEHRAEVLCALAALDDARRDDLLRAAVRTGAPIPADAPAAAATLLARTLRQLGRDDLVRTVPSNDAYPLPVGSIELERAHAAFAEQRFDVAGNHLRAASVARSLTVGERHPLFAECATLAGRILHRTNQLYESRQMFREALEILQRAPLDHVRMAEALGAYAELQCERDRVNEALIVAFDAVQLVDAMSESAAVLPAMLSARNVFETADEVTRTCALEQRIAAIRAQYAP